MKKGLFFTNSAKILIIIAFAAVGFFIHKFYLGNGIHLRGGDFIRFWFFILIFAFPYGDFFLRAIGFKFTADKDSLYERIVLALTTGYVLSAITCYLLTWFISRYAFIPVSLLLFAHFVFRGISSPGKWRGRWKDIIRRAWLDFDSVLGLFILLVLIRYLITYCYIDSGHSGPVKYHQYFIDNIVNVGMSFEASHGVPLQQISNISGLPFHRYHFMGCFFSWIASSYSGADLLHVFHVYLPIFLNILVVASIFFTCVRFTKNKNYGYLGAFIMFFSYFPVSSILFKEFSSPYAFQISYVYTSFPSFAAFPILLGFFHALSFREPGKENPSAGIVTALCAAALCMYKGNYFIVLFPAYVFMIAAGALVKPRNYRELSREIAALFVFSFVVAAIYLPYKSVVSIQFNYGFYANYLYLKYFHFTQPVLRSFNYLPKWLIYFISASLRPFFVIAFGTLPFFAVYFFFDIRKLFRDRLKLLFIFIYVFTVFVFLCLVDAHVYADIAKNIPEMIYAASIFPGIIGIKIVVDWIRRRFKITRAVKIVLSGALCALVVISAVPSMLTTTVPAGAFQYELDRNAYTIWGYVREATPIDSVILTSDFEKGAETIFGGRRTVLEAVCIQLHHPEEYALRSRDIKAFFATKDSSAAQRILEKYKVDYVIASGGATINFPYKNILSSEKKRGDAGLYKVISSSKR